MHKWSHPENRLDNSPKKRCATKNLSNIFWEKYIASRLPLAIYLYRCHRTSCSRLVEACKILNNWVSCCLYLYNICAQHHSKIFVEFSIMYPWCMPIYRSFVKFRSKSSNLCTFNYFGWCRFAIKSIQSMRP